MEERVGFREAECVSKEVRWGGEGEDRWVGGGRNREGGKIREEGKEEGVEKVEKLGRGKGGLV